MAEKCRSIIQDPCCVPRLRESKDARTVEESVSCQAGLDKSPGNPATAHWQDQVGSIACMPHFKKGGVA